MNIDLTTIIACRDAKPPSFAAIRDALRRISLQAKLEDILDGGEETASGGLMLRFGGNLTMAVLSMAVPMPIETLVYGPSPNFLWPTAEQDLAAHKAHIRVMVIDTPETPDQLIATAKR
jgi:hypothetical protein